MTWIRPDPPWKSAAARAVFAFGLAKHYPGPDFLVTDPSQTFLRLTQSQFGSGEGFPPRLHFAVLNADDLAQLPAEMFSLITMRSTLHHILGS